MIIAILVLPLIYRLKRGLFAASVAFLGAVFLHILLDTIAGDILWGWPFSDTFFSLITVPPRFESWIFNFVLHPVFLLEIAIWIAAIWLWIKRR